jgi:ComF family protein
MQTVIHSLKYQERAKLGLELGRMLANLLPIEDVGPIDMLTVVPLHTVKTRERGYNQAQWIGKALAKTWCVPFNPTLLQRVRYTESQTTLNSEERKKNMANAFRVRRTIDQQAIGIVDDVLTTGSTLSACAQALLHGGAREVIAITCATPKTKTDQTVC